MSKVSKKCNHIINKINSISGLDDHFVYKKLLYLELIVDWVVDDIDNYLKEDELNGVSENVRRWLNE